MAGTDKRAVRGRPTKYTPDACDSVIASGEAMKTIVGMGEALGITRQTFNAWRAAHPEFDEAVRWGLQKAQAQWEDMGRLATFGGIDGFNATSYIYQMKNRFKDDWRDKVETEHSGHVAVTQVTRVVVDPKD